MNNKTQSRLPIIVIGGFLGSGKTTLVNQLLSDANGKRLVIFVNDFGNINIDYALVETVEQDRISFKNGCVCCSLNEDLVASVSEFASSENTPDAIVIEASGVADPKALDSSFSILEASGAAVVDTRVYVLDADGFGGMNYEDSELIIDNAAAADLVVLNKCDLATAEKLQSLEELLTVSAPYSGVIQTQRCAVPLKFVLSERAVETRSRPERVREDITHDHGEKYAQWSGQTELLIDRKKFTAFANELPKCCLRSKGFLRFSDAPNELVCFNLVGVRASYEKHPSQETIASQLVVIGKRETISTEFLTAEFTKLQSAV